MLSSFYKTIGFFDIAILCFIILIIMMVIVYKKWAYLRKKLRGGALALRAIISGSEENEQTDYETIDELIEASGYSYDETQDIFYSTMNPWQKEYGYSRLYDEASALFGMIMDCEPIYFKYDNKIWLIEFWKGQYGMCTGCEVGVYTREWPYYYVPKDYADILYYAASDLDLLSMSCCLKKNNESLFTRKGKHWWLTGFRLGEFSNPSELTMDIYITLKDEVMCDAFVGGLKNAGYPEDEINVKDNSVKLKYDKPYTRQPFTRSAFTDWIIQSNNRTLCERYQEITKDCDNIYCRIEAIRQYAPDLYELIINLGKTKRFFDYSNNDEGIKE